jgi:broad specificity phosphatase PhoE
VTELILVRHGETDWNLARRIQGTTDIPLNETGRQQARAAAVSLAESIPPGVPVVVVSSDLVRASETAGLIAAALGAPSPRLYSDLRERGYGEAEGALVDDFKDRWGEWHVADVPGAESWADVRARGVRAMRMIAQDARRTTAPAAAIVVAVSHGAMIGELMRHASGGTLPQPGHRIENGSAHRFLVERESLRMLAEVPASTPAVS